LRPFAPSGAVQAIATVGSGVVDNRRSTPRTPVAVKRMRDGQVRARPSPRSPTRSRRQRFGDAASASSLRRPRRCRRGGKSYQRTLTTPRQRKSGGRFRTHLSTAGQLARTIHDAAAVVRFTTSHRQERAEGSSPERTPAPAAPRQRRAVNQYPTRRCL
jgi:hypothetical protein